MATQISCCFYPTTVALIDDDKRFMQTFLLDFKNINSVIKTYEHPDIFLEFINNSYQYQPLTKRCVSWLDEELLNHRALDVDIASIAKIYADKNRSEEVSVIISDFAMPSMDGIELFKKIKNSKAKKILLTGEADESIAIKAFNAGIIDKYIRKDADDFFNLVKNSIYELQLKYFTEESELITNTITKDPERPSCLDDPIFIEFFEKLIAKNSIKEFYLLDEYGSFLLINKKQKPLWLIVKNELAMEYYEQLAEECDPQPAKIIQAIAKRKKVPFLLTEKDRELSPKDWADHLYNAKQIIGREIYYFALVKKP